MKTPRVKTLPLRVSAMPLRVAVMQPDSWRADKQGGTARGYGYKWQQARLGYLAKHPLCVMCERDGRVTEATVVDHIAPHRGDMTLFWDANNWQALCKPHHDGEKQREERGGR